MMKIKNFTNIFWGKKDKEIQEKLFELEQERQLLSQALKSIGSTYESLANPRLPTIVALPKPFRPFWKRLHLLKY